MYIQENTSHQYSIYSGEYTHISIYHKCPAAVAACEIDLTLWPQKRHYVRGMVFTHRHSWRHYRCPRRVPWRTAQLEIQFNSITSTRPATTSSQNIWCDATRWCLEGFCRNHHIYATRVADIYFITLCRTYGARANTEIAANAHTYILVYSYIIPQSKCPRQHMASTSMVILRTNIADGIFLWPHHTYTKQTMWPQKRRLFATRIQHTHMSFALCAVGASVCFWGILIMPQHTSSQLLEEWRWIYLLLPLRACSTMHKQCWSRKPPHRTNHTSLVCVVCGSHILRQPSAGGPFTIIDINK